MCNITKCNSPSERAASRKAMRMISRSHQPSGTWARAAWNVGSTFVLIAGVGTTINLQSLHETPSSPQRFGNKHNSVNRRGATMQGPAAHIQTLSRESAPPQPSAHVLCSGTGHNSRAEPATFTQQARDIARLSAHVLCNGTRHSPHTGLAAFAQQVGDITHPPVHVHRPGNPRGTTSQDIVHWQNEQPSQSKPAISHSRRPTCYAAEQGTIHSQSW